MKPTRRDLLATAGAAWACASMSGCEKLVSRVTEKLGQSIPEVVGVSTGACDRSGSSSHVGAAYGPWPGDLEAVRAMALRHGLSSSLRHR